MITNIYHNKGFPEPIDLLLDNGDNTILIVLNFSALKVLLTIGSFMEM